MPITGGNQAAMGIGTKVQVDVAPWVTAGGAGTFRNLGWLDGDKELTEAVEYSMIKPSNALGALQSWISKRELSGGGALLGMDLEALAILRGGVPADMLAASGVATLPIKDLLGTVEWQMKLTFPDQSSKPAYAGFTSDVYTKLTLTIWRVKFKPRGAMSFNVTNPWKVAFDWHALQDYSVTASTTTDQWGKWALSTT